MRRYLVVANQTLGGEHLMAKVRACMAAGPCEFHILVPATPPPDKLLASEGEARALAQRRLEEALRRFAELGATATGEVGDHRPLEAMADVVRHRDFDEIILSTLPPGPSKWLKADLPNRAARAFTIPVTHVVAAPEPATAG
jgi:GABA permease